MTFTSAHVGTVSCLYKEAVSDVPTAHYIYALEEKYNSVKTRFMALR